VPIAISGNGGGMVEADYLLAAIEKRFLETGHPRDLTLIHSLGIGDREQRHEPFRPRRDAQTDDCRAFHLVTQNAGAGEERRD
jgi:hypothetical protein